MQHPLTLIGLGLGYVACALAMNVVMRIHLTRDLWQLVAQSAEIHNLAAAQNVSAQGSLTGAIGEGFADSLDVGGF
jgi:phosphomevalonate kinase